MAGAQQAITVETVAAMMQGMQQNVLLAVAEMVKEMKKPYVDEKWLERERREAAKTKRDMEQVNAVKKLAQERCSHKYKKSGVWAISLVHNYPDRQTRGHCNLCKLDIEPERWAIEYDAHNASGKPVKLPAHSLYHVVRELESEATWQLVG